MSTTTEAICVDCHERPATEIDGMYCTECFHRVCDEYAANAERDITELLTDQQIRNAMGEDGCPHDGECAYGWAIRI